MKRYGILTAIFCFLFNSLSVVRAAEMDVGIEAELKAVSAFVWRGRTLNEDPCFQPSFNFSSGNFSANAWGSWNLTDVSNSWQSSRVDLSLYYTFIKGKHIIRPGFTAFIYHDDPDGKADDTYECFVGYTYDSFLLPSVALYYDFSGLDGFFMTASIAHSFILVKDKMALDMKLQLEGADKEYSNNLFTYPDAETPEDLLQDSLSLIDATATISLPISVGKNGALTPALKYVMILDSVTQDVVDQIGDQDENIFVYSIAFSMSF